MARIVRGFFLAQLCLALSVGSHAVAGGPVHLSTQTLLGWLGLSVACVAVAQRRRSFASIATIVMLSQVALHLMMLPPSQMDHGMHGGHAVALPSLMMAVGHVVATVLASVLLAYGEHLLWALWSHAGLPRVPSTLRSVPAGTGSAVVPATGRAPEDGRILAGGGTRRGPPRRARARAVGPRRARAPAHTRRTQPAARTAGRQEPP